MTTIPNNFNPTIPDRSDAKAFTAYALSVMLAYANGKPIANSPVSYSAWCELDPSSPPLWRWDKSNYAILPEPAPPTYRWPTDEEWCKRFTDLRWQAVLVRMDGEVLTARLVRNTEFGWFLVTWAGDRIRPENYTKYPISLDGGKTWRNPGIQESGVDE